MILTRSAGRWRQIIKSLWETSSPSNHDFGNAINRRVTRSRANSDDPLAIEVDQHNRSLVDEMERWIDSVREGIHK